MISEWIKDKEYIAAAVNDKYANKVQAKRVVNTIGWKITLSEEEAETLRCMKERRSKCHCA